MVSTKAKGPISRTPSTVAAFVHYTPRLHQYLRKLLRDPREIPDIVQETFKRFLSRADRPEIIQDPLAFLLGMARNVAREACYQERRRMIMFDSEFLDQHSDSLDQAADGSSAEDLVVQEDIARALKRLPDAHLAVLMLVDGEGRSYDEAARITGFTRSTVATYLMQARSKLRYFLEDLRSHQDAPK